MSFDITLGNFKVKRLEKVRIERRIEIIETAEITFPASAYNQAFSLEKKIKHGDTVLIKLGYDGENKDEFTGFIESISSDDSLIVHCRNASLLLEKEVKNTRFKNASLKEVLGHVITADSRLSLDVASELDQIKIESFTVMDATGIDLLKKLKEVAHIEVIFEGNKLIARLPFSGNGKLVSYDFAKNIEKSSLKFLKSEDKKVFVKVIGIDKKNKKTVVEVGEKGGDTLTIHRYNISDKNALKLIGEQEIKKYSYDGYEGSFTGWLVPFTQPADSVNLSDAGYAEKNGRYYVTSVTTDFSHSGGSRKIELGVKLG